MTKSKAAATSQQVSPHNSAAETTAAASPPKRRRKTVNNDNAESPGNTVSLSNDGENTGSSNTNNSTHVVTPATTSFTYQEGFPKLLFEGLQAANDGNSNVASNVVAQAAQALATKFEEEADDNLCDEFLSLGGHSILVATMKAHAAHPGTFADLCSCLTLLMFHHNHTHPEKRRVFGVGSPLTLEGTLLLMGALEVLVQAMVDFPQAQDLQAQAMTAVGNLCSLNNAGDASTQIRMKVAQHFLRDMGGASLVVQAMRTYATVETIQENGCWLLRRTMNSIIVSNTASAAMDNTHTLALGSGDKAILKSARVLSTVAIATEAFPANNDIEREATLLWNAMLVCGEEEEN